MSAANWVIAVSRREDGAAPQVMQMPAWDAYRFALNLFIRDYGFVAWKLSQPRHVYVMDVEGVHDHWITPSNLPEILT